MRKAAIGVALALVAGVIAPRRAHARDGDPSPQERIAQLERQLERANASVATLEARVARLEERIATLEKALAASDGQAVGGPGAAAPAPPTPASPRATPAAKAAALLAKFSEEQDARRASLERRAKEWVDSRKRLVREKCTLCKGFSVVTDARTGATVTCPTCDGRRVMLAPTAFRKVHYELMTEAWRGRSGAQEALKQEYRQANASGDPLFLTSPSKIDRVELVGARFGRAWVFQGTDSVSREERWVAVVESASRKETWYSYNSETDSPWDETPLVPPLPAPEALTAAEAGAVRAKIGLALAKHVFESGRREGTALVVSVFDASAVNSDALDVSVAKDTVPLTRAALTAFPDAESVRILFLARWRDSLGNVAMNPYRTAEISREKFSKINQETLTPEEQLALWERSVTAPPGEIMWWK